MNLEPYFVAEAIPLHFTALVYVVLAIVLAVRAGRSISLWAFAVYSLVAGFGFAATIVWDYGPTAAAQTFGARLVQIFLAPDFAALVAFALYYPHPRLRPANRRLVLGSAIAIAIVIVLVALVKGSSAFLVVQEDGVHVGPMLLAAQLALCMTAVVAFVVSRELWADCPSNEHRTIWLVVLGFTLYPIYRGVRALIDLLDGNADIAEGAVWATLTEGLQFAVTPLALVAAWRLARDRTNRFAWGVAAAVLASIMLGVLTATEVLPRAVTLGVVPLVLPVVVAYALLRLRFARLDGQVRWSLSKGAVASILVVAFLIGSQIIQNITTTEYGLWGGAIAAGGALFALQPISRLADRFARAAIPVVATPEGSARPPAQEDTYRASVRKFLADGTLSRDDERHLARLTTSLGIDAARAFELREEVESDMTTAGKRKPRSPRRRTSKSA